MRNQGSGGSVKVTKHLNHDFRISQGIFQNIKSSVWLIIQYVIKSGEVCFVLCKFRVAAVVGRYRPSNIYAVIHSVDFKISNYIKVHVEV